MKKALETLLFRVREILTRYGAGEAFFLGSLKLKNLDGEEISSQPFKDIDGSSSEDEQDEEDPTVGGGDDAEDDSPDRDKDDDNSELNLSEED
jgi:Fanconi anemia group D2 protein